MTGNLRFFALAFLLLAAPAVWAGAIPPLALDFDLPTINFTNGNWSLGWQFNVTSPYTVTRLGFYDDQQNDLTESHEVGIWNSAGTLLVSGTVTPGSPLISWFRWTDVTPTVLAPGEDYRIAAVTGTENYTFNVTGLVTDPNIGFVTSRFSSTTGELLYPTSVSQSQIGLFGPNFAGGDVPEPATWLLLGCGLAAAALLRRRQ